MSIELTKDIVSISTGVATLLTLLALLFQLRMVKSEIHTNTQLSIMQDERSLWAMAMQNETCRDGMISRKFLADNEQNAAIENLMISNFFDHYEKVYFQYRNGAFPEELWPSWEAHIVRTLARTDWHTNWEASKGVYWSEFTKHFDPMIQALRTKKSVAG